MKNRRQSRTVWVIVDDKPWLPKGDRRKNVVHFIHYSNPESGQSMHTHWGEEGLVGAMEFPNKLSAEFYFRDKLRGHHNRQLKAVEVTITTSHKFV